MLVRPYCFVQLAPLLDGISRQPALLLCFVCNIDTLYFISSCCIVLSCCLNPVSLNKSLFLFCELPRASTSTLPD